MNGYRTPNEETDLAGISQRTENKKIGEKLMSEHKERTLSPVR